MPTKLPHPIYFKKKPRISQNSDLFFFSLSYLNFTAQAFVFQRSIMEQKLLAQTAHINTALQCSAQTTAEPSFNQRHSHRYCHPAAFQQLNTRTLTRLLPPQLRVPQRMYDSLISILFGSFYGG